MFVEVVLLGKEEQEGLEEGKRRRRMRESVKGKEDKEEVRKRKRLQKKRINVEERCGRM